MFTWLNKQGVRSSEGFEFQRTGRFTAEYRENGRVTCLRVESGGGVLTIYDSSLQGLWNVNTDPSVRKRARDRIIGNLRAALAFQGLALELR